MVTINKLILLFSILFVLGCSHTHSTVHTGFEGKLMPSFNLLLMDSTTQFNTSQIPDGKPIVVLFFNPHCPFCRAETEDMVLNIKTLANIRFILLSNYSFTAIKQYYNEYHLEKYSNVIVGQDSCIYFGDYYKAKGVPYTAIFTKERKLNRAVVGRISAKEIKEIISE